jgi:phosphoribosylformimino-5-aminoimidazole carboxamide ribotide isomerase
VIASGGVFRIEEIRQLMELEPDGVIGVIVGRALYTGRLDLEEAIRLVKRTRCHAELVSASHKINSDPEPSSG